MTDPARPARHIARCAGWLVACACRWPRVTLLAWLLLAAGAGFGAWNGLTIDTSTDRLLSQDLPFQRAARAFDGAFPMLDDALVVVVTAADRSAMEAAAQALATWMAARPEVFTAVFYPEGDPYLRRHALLYLPIEELEALLDRTMGAQALLTKLAEHPPLRGLAALLVPAIQSGSDLSRLQAPLDAFAATAEALQAGAFRPVDWQTLLAPEANRGPDFRLILALPALDYGTLAPAEVAMAALAAADRELGLSASGVQVALTGKPAVEADDLQTIRSNLLGVGLLSYLVVTALLIVALRSWRATLAVSLLLVTGLLITAGFAWLSIGELNLFSVSFAILFIGLSVDYGLHYLLRAGEDRLAGAGPTAALCAAAREQGPALLLCALTSCLAFLSFLPTAYTGLGELGLISAFGVVLALLLAFTLVPAALRLVGWNVRGDLPGVLAHRWQVLTQRHRRPLLVLAALLALFALWPASQIDFQDDVLALRDPAAPSIVALQRVLGDPRAQPWRADVLRDDLAAADRLAAELDALPEVGETVTASDLVPDRQEEKLALLADAQFFLEPVLAPSPRPVADAEDRQAAAEQLAEALQRAPAQLQPAAQRLSAALFRLAGDPAGLARLEEALIGNLPTLLDDLALALSADRVTRETLPAALLGRYLAPDGRARVEVRPAADLRDKAARRSFAAAVLALAPDAAGEAVLVTEARRVVLRSLLEAGLCTLLACLAVVYLVLRRGRDLLLSFAPLFLAGLLTAAATVLLGQQINFANIIVLPLLFGLGIDSSLHLVARWREAPDRPLMENSSPRAIVFSALTTIASFGSLALAQHLGLASMGLLLTLALSAVLASVFLLVPALLGGGVARRAGKG